MKNILLQILYLCRLMVEVVCQLDFSKAQVELESNGIVQVLVEVEGVHHACVCVERRQQENEQIVIVDWNVNRCHFVQHSIDVNSSECHDQYAINTSVCVLRIYILPWLSRVLCPLWPAAASNDR